MYQGRYSILFSSMTGNTKKLADAIHEALPAENCDFFGSCQAADPQSPMLYIGFWTDKGSADSDTLELLAKLRDKKIFLFGTAGFGISEDYFLKVLGNVKKSIDPSNTVIGEFMCQGKMPQSVRDRYVQMKEQPDCPENIDTKIANFDLGLSHPDQNDLERLTKIATEL